MSYICSRCGTVVYRLPKVVDSHPYGSESAAEEHSNWTCSCGGEYEYAKKCKLCDKTKSEETVTFYGNVCEECLSKYAEDFDLVKKCSDKSGAKTTVEVDSLVLSLLSPMDVNTVLWEYIKSGFDSSAFGSLLKDRYKEKAKKWALEDVYWFFDALCEVLKNG